MTKHIGFHVKSAGAAFKLARIGCRITLLLLTFLIQLMMLTLRACMSVPVDLHDYQRGVEDTGEDRKAYFERTGPIVLLLTSRPVTFIPFM